MERRNRPFKSNVSPPQRARDHGPFFTRAPPRPPQRISRAAGKAASPPRAPLSVASAPVPRPAPSAALCGPLRSLCSPCGSRGAETASLRRKPQKQQKVKLGGLHLASRGAHSRRQDSAVPEHEAAPCWGWRHPRRQDRAVHKRGAAPCRGCLSLPAAPAGGGKSHVPRSCVLPGPRPPTASPPPVTPTTPRSASPRSEAPTAKGRPRGACGHPPSKGPPAPCAAPPARPQRRHAPPIPCHAQGSARPQKLRAAKGPPPSPSQPAKDPL